MVKLYYTPCEKYQFSEKTRSKCRFASDISEKYICSKYTIYSVTCKGGRQ